MHFNVSNMECGKAFMNRLSLTMATEAILNTYFHELLLIVSINNTMESIEWTTFRMEIE